MKTRGSYGKTAKVGAMWSVTRQLVHQGIGLPASMIIARLLSPDEFGVAAAAAFFVSLTSKMTELGLNAALVRVKHLRSDHESSVFVVSLALGVVSWLGLTLASGQIGAFFRSEDVGRVVAVTAFAFLVTPWSTVPSALLNRELRFKALAVIDWLGAITGTVTAVVLAWLGFSYWSLIYGQLASTGITVVAKMVTAWRPLSFTVSRRAVDELWSFGLGVHAKRLLEFGTQNLDNLLIGRTIGLVGLGLYDKGFMTVERLFKTLNLGQAVSFRIFAILQNETERFRRAYRRVLLTVAILGLPPFAACIVVAPQLFDVLYGINWRAAVPVFQLLCIGGMIKLTSSHASRANEAKGLIWRQVLQHVLYLILIVVGVWIGSRWGIVGAAAGVLAARLTLAVLIQDMLRKEIEASWSQMLSPLVPGSVIAIIVCAVLLVCDEVVRYFLPSASSLTRLAIQGVLGASAYLPLVLYLPFVELRLVVRETIEEFAPRLIRWAPSALPSDPDVPLTRVG